MQEPTLHAIQICLHQNGKDDGPAIERELEDAGFRKASGQPGEGSGLYLGSPDHSVVDALCAIDDLGRKGVWIRSNIRDVRLLRIESNITAIRLVERTAPESMEKSERPEGA